MSENVMQQEAFTTLLGTTIVPSVMEKIEANSIEKIEQFYQSCLYQLLSDENTSLWHLSATTLAQLYKDEQENGSIEMPEEQS